jgi:hypothetical protein
MWIFGTCGYQLLQLTIPVPVDFSLWKGYIRWCPALCNGNGRHRQQSLLPASVFMYFPISIRPFLAGKKPRSHGQNSSAAPPSAPCKQARKELELITPHMAKTFSSQDPHIFGAIQSTPEGRDCQIFLRLW